MKTNIKEYAEHSISSMNKTMKVSTPDRIYYETEQTITKKSKGWIEVEADFTQVYNQFWKIAARLKSLTTVKLLFWLLSHEANKSNGISSGKPVFDRFNADLKREGVDEVGLRTFHSAYEELITLQVLTKVGKGHYYFNPYLFWKDGKKERVSFIIDETKERKFLSHNPLNPLAKLENKK